MLVELRAFLMVVEEGSFLAAANNLGVSRTTLRRQVDALEARAGVLLLERSRTGVILTEAGAELVRGGRAMERDFGALLHAIRETGSEPAGQVRIHLPTALPPAVMTAIYGVLREGWPGVRVHAAFSDAPQPAKLSDTDVVAWFGEPATGADGESWVQRPVAHVRQRLLARPDYLARCGTPESVTDLEHHDLLAWLAPHETTPHIVTTRGAVLPVRATLATMNAHLIHEAVALGLGIGWVPDGDVPTPGGGPTVRVLENDVGRDVTLWIGAPKVLADRPRIRVFLDHVDDLLKAALG